MKKNKEKIILILAILFFLFIPRGQSSAAITGTCDQDGAVVTNMTAVTCTHASTYMAITLTDPSDTEIFYAFGSLITFPIVWDSTSIVFHTAPVDGVYKVRLYPTTHTDTDYDEAMFTVTGSLVSGFTPSNQTRIAEFFPSKGSEVNATTSLTVGFRGFLNIDDWNSEPANYSFIVNNANGGAHGNFGFAVNNVPLTTFGDFTYTTTTPVQTHDQLSFTACIQYNPITILGFSFAYHSVCDDWGVTVDAHATSTATGFSQEFQDALSSTTDTVTNLCNPFSADFSAGGCLGALIYPPGDILVGQFVALKSIPPWGYGFRFYDILSGNATTSTTTLPAISYTSASSSIFGITTFHFDPFSALTSTSSIVNTKSDQAVPKTVWEIVSPLVHILVYFSLLFMVLHDLQVVRHNENNSRRK